MNKIEFINTLKKELDTVSEEDKKEIIYDYEEHFAIGMENGKSEEEIAADLGSPKEIAKQFKAEYYLKKAENNATPHNIFRAVFASLSLGFINLVFVLGPFIGVLGTLFGLFIAAGAVTVAGIALFGVSVLPAVFSSFISIPLQLVNPAVAMFASIGLTAFGLLFIIADCYLAKFLYIATIKYLKFNLSVITGNKEE